MPDVTILLAFWFPAPERWPQRLSFWLCSPASYLQPGPARNEDASLLGSLKGTQTWPEWTQESGQTVGGLSAGVPQEPAGLFGTNLFPRFSGRLSKGWS